MLKRGRVTYVLPTEHKHAFTDTGIKTNPVEICDWLQDKHIIANDKRHVIAFIGAGTANNEIEVLIEMHKRGYKVSGALFMDIMFTHASIQRMEQYANLEPDAKPALVFTFDDLYMELQFERALYPDSVLAVLGINAGLNFNEASELYECHRFFSYCAQLASKQLLYPYFVNFMGPKNLEFKGIEDECCTTTEWWVLATEIMASKGAKRILV